MTLFTLAASVVTQVAGPLVPDFSRGITYVRDNRAAPAPARHATKLRLPAPMVDPTVYADDLRAHAIPRILEHIVAGRVHRAFDELVATAHDQARVLDATVEPADRYPGGRHRREIGALR